ncbi:glycoside hydrolase [Trichodelitschia bisporula]|uniref:chitinase n=1 Tax=Trichodelitschia bisporula TaxID=703511 RepID=A0A6G1HWS9_9PEZI|nr:glycoside hydrolase [Trichodelitschia bisporula]
MFINAVYYPNYRVYRNQTPSSLRLDIVSHVFYAFAGLKSDGTVYLSDEYADTQISVDGTQGCLRAFVGLKRQYTHLKIILSIGGGSSDPATFASVAADPTTRERFGASARELVDAYGLDGIDVDWEHPTPFQTIDFTALLSTLRTYLPRPRYILSTALPAGAWLLRYIDLPTLSHTLDLLNLMAYDFYGPWTPTAGHHAALYAPIPSHTDPQNPPSIQPSGVAAVEFVLGTGFPAAKILFGIPAFGRSFLGAAGPGYRHKGGGGEDGSFEYSELPRPGAQQGVDRVCCAAYCIGGDGGWVSYDNAETVATKAAFVRDRGLAGLFFWTGTADVAKDVEGGDARSLVYAGYMALHDRY